jgi:hypothetical protein
MWYEETDIIFGLRASISIKITYFLFYRKIMTPIITGKIVAFSRIFLNKKTEFHHN